MHTQMSASPANAPSREWPRITLVTPCYNRAEYLEEAILSVLEQDYPNLEYIIVDGGSTNPEVLRIIRKYESRLAWWISERDGGHAEAIRKGFDRSNGEIMNWLCSDDSLLPGALRTIGQAFREHPEADVVYGNANLMDEHGRFLREIRTIPYATLSLIAGMSLHQTSVFWKRSLYDRVGGNVGGKNLEYNRYSPDSDLFFRFARAKAKWVFTRTALANYRVHAGQTSTSEVKEVREYAWKATRREYPFWGYPPVFNTLRLVMRFRKLYWHLRQGEASYVLHNLSHTRGSKEALP